MRVLVGHRMHESQDLGLEPTSQNPRPLLEHCKKSQGCGGKRRGVGRAVALGKGPPVQWEDGGTAQSALGARPTSGGLSVACCHQKADKSAPGICITEWLRSRLNFPRSLWLSQLDLPFRPRPPPSQLVQTCFGPDFDLSWTRFEPKSPTGPKHIDINGRVAPPESLKVRVTIHRCKRKDYCNFSVLTPPLCGSGSTHYISQTLLSIMPIEFHTSCVT